MGFITKGIWYLFLHLHLVSVFIFVAQEAVQLGSTKKPQMANDWFWSVDVGR